MKPNNRNLVARLMSEVTMYGGLPMRRCDVLTLATEHLGAHARDRFGADYFAFSGPAVDFEPWPLEAARALDDERPPCIHCGAYAPDHDPGCVCGDDSAVSP